MRLTDLIRAGFRKTNVVKFTLSNELGHNACALFKGNAMNDTCRLEQVEFFGPTELGKDKIDLAFECCLSATQVKSTIHIVGEIRTGHHMDWMECHTMPIICIKTRVYTLKSYLHREKCLVCVTRVSLEEAREKLEVGSRGIEPIELAYSLKIKRQNN